MVLKYIDRFRVTENCGYVEDCYSPVLTPKPLVSHPLSHACIHLRTDAMLCYKGS